MGLVHRSVSAAALLLLVSACGGGAVDPPSVPVDELTAHDGEFCPATLPLAPRETYGFGTEERATGTPSLWEPEEAWLCTYQTRDIAAPGSNGAWYEWSRRGAPRELVPNEIAAFSEAIMKLRPRADGGFACPADLGARFLVSYSHERDLTGVVFDDYGCGFVRITDDPFVTVPGDSSQPGTVTGVLDVPAGVLAELGVGRSR